MAGLEILVVIKHQLWCRPTLNKPQRQELFTRSFFGITNRCEIISAFALVLVQGIDWQSPSTHIISRDLFTGNNLPKDFLVEGAYTFFVWIVLSLICSCVDSARLLSRVSSVSVFRSIGTQLGSKRAAVVFLMILFQCLQPEYLHSLLSAIHPYAPNFGVVSTLILVLMLVRPPTTLLLATSTEHAIPFLRRAKSTMHRLRCVTLLDADKVKIPHRAMLPTDNLRAFDFVKWERTVQALMDHLPLIIVDGRSQSVVVAEEFSWILSSPARAHKTILVTTDEGEVNLSPNAASAARKSGVQLSTLEALPAVVWGGIE